MSVKQIENNSLGLDALSRPVVSISTEKHEGALGKHTFFAIKRVFDVVFSIVLLIASSPLILLVCTAIKLTSKGPVIYRHQRIGKNGKPIDVLKFRTMIDDADKMIDRFSPEQKMEWLENYKVTEDPRVTKVGKLLRITSIDELPQLINIIKGEMSLIGPRPVVTEEVECYGENKDKFLSMTPGLTGYWQAYARNNCSYTQRMEMELYYIDNASLLLDIRILFATVIRVLSCKGAR